MWRIMVGMCVLWYFILMKDFIILFLDVSDLKCVNSLFFVNFFVYLFSFRLGLWMDFGMVVLIMVFMFLNLYILVIVFCFFRVVLLWCFWNVLLGFKVFMEMVFILSGSCIILFLLLCSSEVLNFWCVLLLVVVCNVVLECIGVDGVVVCCIVCCISCFIICCFVCFMLILFFFLVLNYEWW